MKEGKKSTSRYAKKHKGGCEVNHQRHPAKGIPWCSLCERERRC